jgi:hypothetical protein
MLDLLAVSVVTIATSADTPVKTQPPHVNATTSIDIVDPGIVAPYPPISHPVATCPPGEFASAFSDVYPTDWAYQAVSQLASTPTQCFDLPNKESGEFPRDWAF